MPICSHRYTRITAAILTVVIAGSCSSLPERLDVSESRICVAQGRYESSSAFGFPICQFRYADGGKTCVDKADCQGRCLMSVDGPRQTRIPRGGEAAKGLCQAQQYNPGCFATIEGGKITAEGAVCED
jgi:hypothetical protein